VDSAEAPQSLYRVNYEGGRRQW